MRPGWLPCLLDQVKSLSAGSNFAIVNVSRYRGQIHVASFKVKATPLKGLQQEQQVLFAYHFWTVWLHDWWPFNDLEEVHSENDRIVRVHVNAGYFLTPPEQVTSPTWHTGPPPWKQALSINTKFPALHITDQFPIKCSYSRPKVIFFLYPLSPTAPLENSTLHNKKFLNSP